jgi:hypothetical protein
MEVDNLLFQITHLAINQKIKLSGLKSATDHKTYYLIQINKSFSDHPD